MTGIFMLKLLAILLAAFGAAELIAWASGETLSQWVIKEKNRSLWSRLIILSLIFAVTAFLVVHFELLK